jgi:hypothetical protein
MDSQMRNLNCEHIQSDEIWTFCQKKQRHLQAEDSPEGGDAWVFVAIDADTKLTPAYKVGKRDRETTHQFLTALRGRMAQSIIFRSQPMASISTARELRMCSQDKRILAQSRR